MDQKLRENDRAQSVKNKPATSINNELA
jgi:hypothetical protein